MCAGTHHVFAAPSRIRGGGCRRPHRWADLRGPSLVVPPSLLLLLRRRNPSQLPPPPPGMFSSSSSSLFIAALFPASTYALVRRCPGQSDSAASILQLKCPPPPPLLLPPPLRPPLG